MKALVYQKPGILSLDDRPMPRPDDGEALIEIRYAGICGTDMAIVSGKHPRAHPPLVPGHEFSGLVVEAPNNRYGIKPGDSVVPYPLISCGSCHACRTGNPHVCRSLKLLGIDCDGGMAQYATVPMHMLFRFQSELPFDMATLIEPLAVCLHGIRESRLKIQDHVLISGAGPIGILTGLLLKDAGLSSLYLSEPDPYRLSVCARLGLQAIDVKRTDLVSFIRSRTADEGVDLLFEASGAEAAAGQMTEWVRCKGQIVMLSVHKEPRLIDLRQINFKEINLIGSRVYTREDFSLAIHCAMRLRPQLEAVVTHRLNLADGAGGLKLIDDPNADTLKVLINCSTNP